MRSTKIIKICSSSLCTCLHHMVILRTRNKITDFLMILAWASPFNLAQIQRCVELTASLSLVLIRPGARQLMRMFKRASCGARFLMMPNMAVLLAAYTAKIFKNTIPHKYSFDNKHNYYLKAILPLIKFLRIVSLTLNDIIFVCFILNNMF